MRYLVPILLLLLMLCPSAAQEENPFPNGILADGVTLLEKLPELEPSHLFEQEGNWRMRDGRLCNLASHECTEALAQYDSYNESMGAECEASWADDAFITVSPNDEWIVFTDCGAKNFPNVYTFFAYYLPSAELLVLGSDYSDYLEAVAWIDEDRLLIASGELRTSGGHAISLLNMLAEPYITPIASQFAYKPQYFADDRLVLWGEGIPDSTNSFLMSARQILSFHVDSHEIQTLAQIDYTEPQQPDSTVAFPISLSNVWLVVGDSFPLSSGIALYFFDRQTGELMHREVNLPNDETAWQIGNESQSLYYSAYTYDGLDTNTSYTLNHLYISQEATLENAIMTSEFSGEISLSDDENYLLIAWAEEDKVQIYDTQQNIIYPLLSRESACQNCRMSFEWLPDNTLILSITDQGRWRIRIDAISGEQS
jgi:hypothetical protein